MKRTVLSIITTMKNLSASRERESSPTIKAKYVDGGFWLIESTKTTDDNRAEIDCGVIEIGNFDTEE